jgi:cation diffusion facilitator family transporter
VDGVVSNRHALLTRGIRLELLTIVWMVLEAAIAIGAGLVAESLALVAFGADSVIELISGAVLFYRLTAERRGVSPEDTKKLERLALWVVGATFVLLSIYVVYEAVITLRQHAAPEPSAVGMALAVAALIVMPALGLAKQKVGRGLGSAALIADAKETFACGYLSLTLFLGLILNASFGWWWADSVAAILMIPFLLREAWEAVEEAREDA